MAHPDVVVVGNGAVGLSVAAALAATGQLTVTLAGPSARDGAASAAAGAMLGCFGEITRHSLASSPGRLRFEMQRSAHSRWPAFLAELDQFADRPLMVAPDTYVVLNARGGTLDSANLGAMEEALERFGAPHMVVGEVPGLVPTATGRPLRALHLPDEGAVDAGRLLLAMEGRALAAGVTLVDQKVRRLQAAGDAVVGVETADGTMIGASQVVVAAGAWTGQLLRGLSDPNAVQPVLAGSGVAYVAERVMGAGLTSAVRTVTRAGSCGLHALPLGGNVEYFGATNVIFGEPELRPHLGVCAFLADCAIDQIDREVSFSRIDEMRIGNRPVPLDTFPLLGPGPLDGLWVISGGYRDGLHAAPEVAAVAASSVVAGVNEFPVEFLPTRRPLSTMSIEASIDDFVDQQVASAFEGGLALTPFLGADDLDRTFRPLAERLYERLGVADGLAPDLVTYLAVTRKNDADVDAVADYLQAVGRS